MKFPLYAQFEHGRKIVGGAYVRVQDMGSSPSWCWSPVTLLEDGSFYFSDESPVEVTDINNSSIEELRIYS